MQSSKTDRSLSNLITHLSTLDDPRVTGRCDHPFVTVLIVTVLGVLNGANGWEQIDDFARDRRAWLSRYVSFPKGLPSHDTYRRLCGALRPAVLAACVEQWVRAAAGSLNGKLLSFDGKALRGAQRRSAFPKALHKVHLWAHEQRLVLAQGVVDGAADEPAALIALLAMLDVEGAMLTGDAQQVTRAVACAIVEAKAGYTLTVKGNRKALHASLMDRCASLPTANCEDVTVRHHVERTDAHGRWEEREGWLIAASEVPRLTERMPGARSAMLLVRRRFDGKTVSREEHVVISTDTSVKRVMAHVRSHWGVENSLHWVLDVQMGEDACAVRDANAAGCLSVLRTFALAVLRRDTTFKAGIARKQERFGRNDEYADHILSLI